MIYYAPALIMTLIMAYFFSTEYEMPNGVKVKALRNFATALVVILPLALVAAFRWEVGSDTWYGAAYWEAYQAAKEGENLKDFEPLFYLFTLIVAKFNLPFFWYIFIHSVVFACCVAFALSRGSINPVWSIVTFFFIYIFFDSFSALRQAIAEGIIIVALSLMVYLPKSKKKDAIILGLALAALQFHSVALMFIPIYLLSRFKFSRTSLLKVTACAILSYPVIQVLLQFVNRFIDADNDSGYVYSTNGIAVVNLVVSLGVFVVSWYFYDSINELDENAYIYVNISLYVFILMLNSGGLYLAFRYFDMLKTVYLFLVPFIISGIKNNRIRFLVQVIIFLVFLLWFVNAFYIQGNYASNYQSALSDWDRISNLP